MNKKIICFGVGTSMLLASCATSPDKVSAQYVSPLQYQSYSCEQIAEELSRVNVRVSEVAGVQQRESNKDKIKMGVGLVIFWPALFLLATDGDKKQELGRLKGEYDALESQANTKNCSRGNPPK